MATNRKLDYVILDLIESSQRTLKTAPLNLGAVAGAGGGVGAVPGGFVGWLPQTRVAYDTTEAASSGIIGSGTLLDNLNHIRYRLANLETGASFTVIDKNTGSIYANTDTIAFSGAGVVITDLGGGDVLATISAAGSGGGGGTALTVKESDGSPIVTNVDTIIFSGMVVADQGSGDVLVYPVSTYYDSRYDARYLKLDASNDPITSTLAIQVLTGYTDGLTVETNGESITGTINQLTANTAVTSPGILIQRQSTGTGNMTGALLDLREYDFGA